MYLHPWALGAQPLLSSSFGSSSGSSRPRDFFSRRNMATANPSLLLLVHQFPNMLQFGSSKTIRIFDAVVDKDLADKAIVISIELFEERVVERLQAEISMGYRKFPKGSLNKDAGIHKRADFKFGACHSWNNYWTQFTFGSGSCHEQLFL